MRCSGVSVPGWSEWGIIHNFKFYGISIPDPLRCGGRAEQSENRARVKAKAWGGPSSDFALLQATRQQPRILLLPQLHVGESGARGHAVERWARAARDFMAITVIARKRA